MKYPVTLQIPVQCADGSIWCYEKKVELNVAPVIGLLLVGYSPNVFGPGKAADNVIRTVVDCADGEVRVGIHGLRDATRNPDEWDKELEPQGWQRDPEALKQSPLDRSSEEDDRDSLYRPSL